MTLSTFGCRVLSIEREPGFRVIESFWIPSDNLKSFAVVFGMTANAITADSIRQQNGRMIATPCQHARCDVLVTLETTIAR
jgi:hypothetical protein